MVDIFDYIKSLVFRKESISRKRRAPIEDYELPLHTKMRRTGTSPFSSSRDEDWIPSTSIGSTVRPRTGLRNSIGKPLWAKENTQIIIDDDDILEITQPSHELNLNKSFGKSKVTSTPKSRLLNGNDDNDVTFLKATHTLGQKQFNAKKQASEYVKPFSYLNDEPKRSTSQNGIKPKDYTVPIFKTVNEVRNKLGLTRRNQHSSTMDRSHQLYQKMQYKELLEKAGANSDSFSKYSTPTGKLFGFGTGRGKRLVEMSISKAKPMSVVDLTVNGDSNITTRAKNKLSTKDTIQKVLDNFHKVPVVIKDSDSDLEVLPNPPSPKPDIRVPRINTLKTLVDSKEHAHEEWLKNLIQKHRKVVSNIEKQISFKNVESEKLRDITAEIRSQRLEDQIAKYLHIKDAVIPIRVEKEAAFPPLTDEDETRIDIALSKRGNHNEILSSKFNLNITRRDILTLAGLNWLNDEVINFYMNLIIERGKISQWPKTYAMNTFFYPKLLKDGHSSLKRWTRRVDIFSYDFIAVPIHLGVHWCMSIVDFKSKKIGYYDSMGSSNNQCLETLLMYLEEEHSDKKKSEYDTSKWKLENVQDIPNQMNGSDCGMFACTFAEVITRGAKISFTQDDMPYLRRKMVLEILNGELMIQ